jgi:ComF family protein
VTIQTGSVQTAPPALVWLSKLADAVVDLLFPPRCVICHRLGAWFCAACIQEVELIQPPVCHRCGLPLPSSGPDPGTRRLCNRCQNTPLILDAQHACAYHGGPLRQAIHEFKYRDLRSLAVPLGRLMAERWAVLALQPDFDSIVPVPLHPRRQRQRGYNQSALLAQELGSCLQKPVVQDVLARIRATVPQVGLNPVERQNNVQGAFRCTSSALSGMQVLLVDDVYTTGSTLESACLALREAGVTSVQAYTLARAKPSSLDP